MENVSPEVAETQLYQEGRNLSQRLDSFLGSHDAEIGVLLVHEAGKIVRVMSDAQVTEQTREAALRALVVMAPITDVAFWRSALGRMVAWHIGYGRAEVPRAHAAAILGVSRQRIAQMVNSGDLAVEGKGIANQSLLHRLWGAGFRG